MGERVEPSGRVEWDQVAQAVAGAAVVAMIFGVLYALLCAFNPFVYVNWLALLGIGGVISYVWRKGMHHAKVRAPWMAVGVAAGLAGIAWTLSWIVYGNLIIGVSGILESGPIWAPWHLAALMDSLAHEPVWGLFEGEDGALPSWAMYGLWGFEGLAMVVFSSTLVHREGRKPFCEVSNQWFEPQWWADVHERDKRAVLAAVKDERWADLFEGPPPPNGLFNRIRVYRAPGGETLAVQILHCRCSSGDPDETPEGLPFLVTGDAAVRRQAVRARIQ